MKSRVALGCTWALLIGRVAQSFVLHPFTRSVVRPYTPAVRTKTLSLNAGWGLTPQDLAHVTDSIQVALAHVTPPPFWGSLLDSYSTHLKEQPLQTKTLTAAILAFTGDALAQFISATSRRNSSTAGSSNGGASAKASLVDEIATFKYDARRGLTFLTFGAVYTGCFQHFWFDYLNGHVGNWAEATRYWLDHHDILQTFAAVQKDDWWQNFDLVSQSGVTLHEPPSPALLAAVKVAVNQFAVIPAVYMPLFFTLTGVLGGLDVNTNVARARSLYLPILKRNYMFWLPAQFFQFYVLPAEYQVPFVCVASMCWTVILSSIGGSTAPTSSRVAYATVSTDSPMPQDGVLSDVAGAGQEQELVTVFSLKAGDIDEMIDTVTLGDVQDALVPRPVREAVGTVSDAVEEALAAPQVRSSARGLALGLLASAADEAITGVGICDALGLEASVGIAVVSAIGAGVGYLAAADDVTNEKNSGETKSTVHELVDSDNQLMEATKSNVLYSSAS